MSAWHEVNEIKSLGLFNADFGQSLNFFIALVNCCIKDGSPLWLLSWTAIQLLVLWWYQKSFVHDENDAKDRDLCSKSIFYSALLILTHSKVQAKQNFDIYWDIDFWKLFFAILIVKFSSESWILYLKRFFLLSVCLTETNQLDSVRFVSSSERFKKSWRKKFHFGYISQSLSQTKKSN